MNELWIRVVVVAAAVAAAVAVGFRQRRRSRGEVREMAATGLAPGLYLFSSHACPTCTSARSRLEAGVGADGFTELVWEDDATVFQRLDVVAVPGVLRVHDDGRGTFYPGQPRAVLDPTLG